MSFEKKSFRWWWEKLAIALTLSMVLAAVLVKSGLVITTYAPPGGIHGPVCYKAGGLFTSGALFPHIACAHFFGSPLAGFLLTRGLYLANTAFPVGGFIWLALEILAAAPVAYGLSRIAKRPGAASGSYAK